MWRTVRKLLGFSQQLGTFSAVLALVSSLVDHFSGVLSFLPPIQLSKVPPCFWIKTLFRTFWGWSSVFILRSPYFWPPEVTMYMPRIPFSSSVSFPSSLSESLSCVRISYHSANNNLYLLARSFSLFLPSKNLLVGMEWLIQFYNSENN